MQVRMIQHGNEEYVRMLDLIKWFQALEEVAQEEGFEITQRAFRVIGRRLVNMLEQFRTAT